MVSLHALAMALSTTALSGLFSDNLGIGLMDCGTSHPQLLASWSYNATLATLKSTTAGTNCWKPNDPSACNDQWCVGVSGENLPNTSGVGLGVFLTNCPNNGNYDPHANFSTQGTYWSYNTSSGRLMSLWTGDTNTGSTRGLCLDHATSGVIELAPCANSSTWAIDSSTGHMVPSPSRQHVRKDAHQNAQQSCLVAINTTSNGVDPWTFSAGNCSAEPHSLLPYCDVSRPIDERIDNVLSHAYLNEMPHGFGRLGFPTPPTGECLHGFVTDCVDTETCATTFPDALATASAFNDTLVELIGKAISTEGRAVTNIARAAMGVGTGDFNLRPHLICWSPDINPFRHPLWGRGQEVPGEDPLLCGKYGAAYVRGLQGKGDPDGKGFLRMAASPKHFLGYDLERDGPFRYNRTRGGGWPDGGTGGHTADGPYFTRHNFTNRMSAQELVEYYAKPFQLAIEEGGAMGTMCSYNALDVFVAADSDGSGASSKELRSTGSIPACAFGALQDGMVRGQWGFDGYTVSDCGAISNFLTRDSCMGHEFTPTHGLCDDANYTDVCPACTSACMNGRMYAGGTDQSCGVAGDQNRALREGQTTKAMLVSSSRRILRVLMSLGINVPEADRPYASLGRDDIDSDATRQLNLEAARQAVVLLKNDVAWDMGERVLPIKPGQTVAVIGPTAMGGQMGSNYGPMQPPQNSSHNVTSPFQALLNAGVDATYQPGAGIGFVACDAWLDGAAKAAEDSDVAVVFVGLDLGQENESNDRNATGYGLGLPGNQEALVRRVQQANPRTAVVLVHGSPLAIDYAKQHVPAILTAHYPGQMGGVAIADVLTGAYNPSGRLTHTFYPGAYANRSIFDTALRASGGQTYIHYDPASYGEPLWEFGHGLSYANFTTAASAGRAAPTTASTAALAAAPIVFAIDVANHGGPDGAFSALGFVRSAHAEAPRNKRLFGYTRAANVAANQSATLEVELTAATAALVEADGTSVLLPGAYNVTVAGVEFPLELTGARVVVAPAPPLFN